MKKDTRHLDIGGRHRTESRYYMIANRIKNSHLRKNKNYHGVNLLVSKDDFIEWFCVRDFYRSSVDRIDKNGHYELSNMQVIPLHQNIAKDKLKHKNGFCVCRVCKINKPTIDFVKSSRLITVGYETICKNCESKRTRKFKFQ